jgi:hypothetical protein
MERRVGERIETNFQVACRVPATPSRGVVLDVSHYGCRLHVARTDIQPGATALLDLPGALHWPGRVVWVHGGQAGIRFQRRLAGPPAVAFGLEAPPAPVAEPVVPEKSDGFLTHWFRRLTGFS